MFDALKVLVAHDLLFSSRPSIIDQRSGHVFGADAKPAALRAVEVNSHVGDGHRWPLIDIICLRDLVDQFNHENVI